MLTGVIMFAAECCVRLFGPEISAIALRRHIATHMARRSIDIQIISPPLQLLDADPGGMSEYESFDPDCDCEKCRAIREQIVANASGDGPSDMIGFPVGEKKDGAAQ